MSRVGKLPVKLPEGVTAVIAERTVTVNGKNGSMEIPVLNGAVVVLDAGTITVTPVDLKSQSRMAWGTTRQLINNAVIGVSAGFKKRLEINGVGLRMQLQGTNLKLSLGFSHEVLVPIPNDVKMKIEGDKNNVLVIEGADKQRVGQVASNIRELKKPEPYKGKGIKYDNEKILRKEGKKK